MTRHVVATSGDKAVVKSHWTPELERQLIDLLGQNLTAPEISKKTGRTVDAIHARARLLNLVVFQQPKTDQCRVKFPKPVDDPDELYVAAFTKIGRGYDGKPYLGKAVV